MPANLFETKPNKRQSLDIRFVFFRCPPTKREPFQIHKQSPLKKRRTNSYWRIRQALGPGEEATPPFYRVSYDPKTPLAPRVCLFSVSFCDLNSFNSPARVRQMITPLTASEEKNNKKPRGTTRRAIASANKKQTPNRVICDPGGLGSQARRVPVQS